MSGEAWQHQFIRDRLETTTGLQDAGKQVRAMLDSPAWSLVAAVLEEAESRTLDKVRPPRLPTQAEYALHHGQAEGLRGASHAVQAVLQEAEKADRRAAEAAGD
jgi:hypothetical protein